MSDLDCDPVLVTGIGSHVTAGLSVEHQMELVRELVEDDTVPDSHLRQKLRHVLSDRPAPSDRLA